MLKRPSARGFTIIELMVGLTIVGVLLAMAGPSFGTFLQNSRLGTAAKSFYTGLQRARAEAVRLNLPVEFVVTDTPVDINIATAAASSPSGRNWVVRYQASASAPFQLIEAKSALEGGGGATSQLQVLSSDASISFNGLGGTSNGNASSLDISNPLGGACAPAGPMRCWRIVVSAGGQVRLCDPLAGAGDSRAC